MWNLLECGNTCFFINLGPNKLENNKLILLQVSKKMCSIILLGAQKTNILGEALPLFHHKYEIKYRLQVIF